VYARCNEINGVMPTEKTVAFFSDASALKTVIGNPPTVVLGPGQPEMAHQTDEFCYVQKIIDATTLFERLINDWQSN
jgi:succinyl-diaminopimelate desuccinylase